MAHSDVVDERIIKYYLLCTTRNGSKRHIATELYSRTRGNMITKKDFDVYLRPHGDHFAVKDSVVGGFVRDQGHNKDVVSCNVSSGDSAMAVTNTTDAGAKISVF